jgi:hypothetical protein
VQFLYHSNADISQKVKILLLQAEVTAFLSKYGGVTAKYGDKTSKLNSCHFHANMYG